MSPPHGVGGDGGALVLGVSRAGALGLDVRCAVDLRVNEPCVGAGNDPDDDHEYPRTGAHEGQDHECQPKGEEGHHLRGARAVALTALFHFCSHLFAVGVAKRHQQCDAHARDQHDCLETGGQGSDHDAHGEAEEQGPDRADCRGWLDHGC